MKQRFYFPLGVAAGRAFCNRTRETRILVDNIHQCKHSVLVATRRYGKSSLALHALKQAGLPFVEVDFYMADSLEAVVAYLLNGVVDLIAKACGPVEGLIASIKKRVKTIRPKLDLTASVVRLELSVDKASDPADSVREALWLLERLLSEKGASAVLLLEEFQNVGVLSQASVIEAAIRHVAQKAKHLSFIFAGSNRKLLQAMFEDSQRPLYKLCWKIGLERIAVEHYEQHLQMIAKKVWQQAFAKPSLDKVLQLTERHPFYMNKLCDRLLLYFDKKPPSVHQIETTWCEILAEEKSDAVKDISLLSTSQKRVLMYIAQFPGGQLMSRQGVTDMALSASSINTALAGLVKKDTIELLDLGYRITSPIIRHYALVAWSASYGHAVIA